MPESVRYIKGWITNIRYQFRDLAPEKNVRLFEATMHIGQRLETSMLLHSDDLPKGEFLCSDVSLGGNIYLKGKIIDSTDKPDIECGMIHFVYGGCRSLFLSEKEFAELLTEDEARHMAALDAPVYERKWTVRDLFGIMAKNGYLGISDATGYDPTEMEPEIEILRERLENAAWRAGITLSESVQVMIEEDEMEEYEEIESSTILTSAPTS